LTSHLPKKKIKIRSIKKERKIEELGKAMNDSDTSGALDTAVLRCDASPSSTAPSSPRRALPDCWRIAPSAVTDRPLNSRNIP